MKAEIRLESRVAVVTGAGRGIGRATAVTLARAGAAVVATARTTAELEETVELIREKDGRAVAVPADVSVWGEVERLAEETRQAFGPADLVVANAGVVDPLGPVWDVDPAAWADNVAVNLNGAFFTARAFLPGMRALRRGVLIFVSTGLAVDPVAGSSAYAASKAGLEQLVRVLAADLEQAQLPIRVHGLYPGIVDTAMQEQVRSQDPARFPEAARFRTFHEKGWLRPPEDPAAVVWWLATQRAADQHGGMSNANDPRILARVSSDLGIPLRGSKG